MKKLFFILFLFALGYMNSYGQRQLPGQKGVELSAGLIPGKNPVHDFYFMRAGVTLNRAKGNYQFGIFEYRHNVHVFEGISIPVESYMVEGGYSFYLLGDWRRTLSLHLGFGAVGGYEVVNKNESILSNGAVIQNENSFIYGVGANLSLEIYLGDKFLFLLQGHAKYLLGTSLEHLRPGFGLGLRYIF